MFYQLSHRNLYIKSDFKNLSQESGLLEINQVELNKSNYLELDIVERHQLFYGDFLNEFSTMVFELK